MPKFKVVVEEQLARTFIVEASDETEAEQRVIDAYKAEDIVLNADDFVGSVEFKTESLESGEEHFFKGFPQVFEDHIDWGGEEN